MPLEEIKAEALTSTETPHELESQFILRLPSLSAASLRAAVRSGERRSRPTQPIDCQIVKSLTILFHLFFEGVLNLKERLTIQIEPDMRRGTVRFDGWVLPAKIVDLPTIIESHKTLDGKNFYKTADICQMMICREDNEESGTGVKTEDLEDSTQKKSKDGKDKKFLYPHGITPPLKNVRKKRFRKTLKKKYVDFPEIEKEVKRLFRTDNEAIHVRYEVVNADDDKQDLAKSNMFSPSAANSTGMDVGEHDLFGEVVSSSDEEDTRVPDSGDDSRMSSSIKDALMKDKSSPDKYDSGRMTEFPKGMLSDMPSDPLSSSANQYNDEMESLESSNAVDAMGAALAEDTAATSALERGTQYEQLLERRAEIEQEISSLQSQRLNQQMEMDNIENEFLKTRYQSNINQLKIQETTKRRQYDELMALINDQ